MSELLPVLDGRYGVSRGAIAGSLANLDLPTITFDSTPLSGGVNVVAWPTALAAPNPKFGFHGVGPENLTFASASFPLENSITAAAAVANTNGLARFTTSYYHFGKTLDLPQYGAPDTVTLFVDDQFIGIFAPAITTGTAQAGGSNTLTLASGANATNGFYNTYWARITGGAGVLGEMRQITGYVGSTKTLTVDSDWTTPTDGTTTYSIDQNNAGFALDAVGGLVKYIHLTWPKAARRKITTIQGRFMGVRTGPYDDVSPAPAIGRMAALFVGDSFVDDSVDPKTSPTMINQIAIALGAQPYNLGSGGRGWVVPSSGSGGLNRLNMQDAIAPPAEAWRIGRTATGGTYTVSVTFGGSTQTTGALDYNASNATIEAALNALSNVSGVGDFAVVRGDFNTPKIFVAHDMVGATISLDPTNLTGGTITNLGQWTGDVDRNLPRDAAGNAMPFLLFVLGSGNDTAASDASVQAASIYIAQQILARFPTAIPIFTGVVGDGNAGDGVAITQTNLDRNAAYAAGAALLPLLNGIPPFIDPYSAGLGGDKWIMGTSTVANPTSGKNDGFKSVTNTGHLTGPGDDLYACQISKLGQSLLMGL